MTHRYGLIAASGLILFAGLLIPAAQARTDPTTWAAVSLASITGGGAAITQVHISQLNDEVAIAYIQSGNLHFMKCDSNCLTASNWVMKNADLTTTAVPLQYKMVHGLADNEWLIFGFYVGNAFSFQHSTNDGTTWTGNGGSFFGTCSGCKVYDIAPTGDFLWGGSGSEVGYGYTPDAGATFPYSSTISDNQGGATSPTQTIAANSARLIFPNTRTVAAVFQSNNEAYEVESDDRIFWTIPYTAAGGSTKAPLTLTNCPSTALTMTQGGVTAVASGATWQAWFPERNGVSNQYLCSYDSSAVSTAYPSAAPATRNDNWAGPATSTLNDAITANTGSMYVAAGREGTSNYVLFKSSLAASWSSVYTTSADTAEFGLTASDTHAYYAYTDNAFGGRLTFAQAAMVPDVLGTGKIFCATKDESSDFGYDDQGGTTNSVDDGDTIEFHASNSVPAWLGKSWGGVNPSPSGIHAARVFFTIRAQTDAASSKFRATFTNTPASGTVSSPTLNDGDKDHTGDFANSVDVLFTETGNQWTAHFYYTTGGGARIPFGSSFVGDAPNTATQYMLEVNTQASTGNRYLALKYSNSTVVPGMNFTIPAEAGKDNAFWYEQWFIAESTTILDAGTQLGNSGLSTCIFGLGASSVPSANGDQGRLVTSGSITGSGSDSSTCSSFLCTDASTVPEGFTVTAFNGFLGLVLVAMVAVGGSTAVFSGDAKPRGFGLVFGTFAIVGYLIGLYFELLPLWPLIVLAVVAGAVVLLKIRSRTD